MRRALLKLIGPRGAWEFFEETSPKSTNKEISEYAIFLARKRLGKVAAIIRQKPQKVFVLFPILVYRYLQLVQIHILARNFPD
jgi:hypothetical protein